MDHYSSNGIPTHTYYCFPYELKTMSVLAIFAHLYKFFHRNIMNRTCLKIILTSLTYPIHPSYLGRGFPRMEFFVSHDMMYTDQEFVKKLFSPVFVRCFFIEGRH